MREGIIRDDAGEALIGQMTNRGKPGADAQKVHLEAAGIKNVLTKSMGSKNHIAVVNATVNALLQLKLAEDFAKVRRA